MNLSNDETGSEMLSKLLTATEQLSGGTSLNLVQTILCCLPVALQRQDTGPV